MGFTYIFLMLVSYSEFSTQKHRNVPQKNRRIENEEIE
jgi:hypothetical protein